MLQFFVGILLCKGKSVRKMKTRVLISFPSIARRHIISILSYFGGSHHARTAQLFVEMQCTSGSKMRPFIKLLVYKIIYQTMSKKWINQTETFQFQAQPPELHTAQHYLKLKKRIYLICCWKNALAERKVISQPVFFWAPELLVCTCLLLSQTLFWEKTTHGGSRESIFGSCKYKQMKNITDVKPCCVVKMNVSENRLLFTKLTGVLHPTLGPPAQDTWT